MCSYLAACAVARAKGEKPPAAPNAEDLAAWRARRKAEAAAAKPVTTEKPETRPRFPVPAPIKATRPVEETPATPARARAKVFTQERSVRFRKSTVRRLDAEAKRTRISVAGLIRRYVKAGLRAAQ